MDVDLSYQLLLLFFGIALLAGFIDSIAGGGGLLTLPSLLALGIPPINALATNKIQGSGGSFSACLYFMHKKLINFKQQKWIALCAFLGSLSGSGAVYLINADILRYVFPFLTIAVALFFLLKPTVGVNDGCQRLSLRNFALTCAVGLGFYDGFFGPGTGSFAVVAFIVLLGQNLVNATANTKLLNFCTNFASVLFFIASGKVIWSLAIVMLTGQILGAQLGARLVIKNGSKLIRPLLITVSTLMSIKLLYDNFLV